MATTGHGLVHSLLPGTHRDATLFIILFITLRDSRDTASGQDLERPASERGDHNRPRREGGGKAEPSNVHIGTYRLLSQGERDRVWAQPHLRFRAPGLSDSPVSWTDWASGCKCTITVNGIVCMARHMSSLIHQHPASFPLIGIRVFQWRSHPGRAA